jgi:hypothetical protein
LRRRSGTGSWEETWTDLPAQRRPRGTVRRDACNTARIRYAIYVFDYGALVGFRLTPARLERVADGNAHEED